MMIYQAQFFDYCILYQPGIKGEKSVLLVVADNMNKTAFFYA